MAERVAEHTKYGFSTKREYADFLATLEDNPETWERLGFRSADEYLDYLAKTISKKIPSDSDLVKAEEKTEIEKSDVAAEEEISKDESVLGETDDGIEITIVSVTPSKSSSISETSDVEVEEDIEDVDDTSTLSEETSSDLDETSIVIDRLTSVVTGVTTVNSTTPQGEIVPVTVSNEVTSLTDKTISTTVPKSEIQLNKIYYKCDPIEGCIEYTPTEAELHAIRDIINTQIDEEMGSDAKTLSRTIRDSNTYYDNLTGIKGQNINKQQIIGQALNELGIYETLDLCLENCYTKTDEEDEGFPCYGCIEGNITAITKKWGDDGYITPDGVFGPGNLCGEIVYKSQSYEMYLTPEDLQATLDPTSPCVDAIVNSTDPVSDCGPSNLVLEFTATNEGITTGQVQTTLEELLDYAVLGNTGSPTLNVFLNSVFPTGAAASISYNQITGNFSGNWNLFNSYVTVLNNSYGTALSIIAINGEISGDVVDPSGYIFSNNGISGAQLQQYANSYCNGPITQTYTPPTTTPNTASKSIFNPTYSGSTTGWLSGFNNNYHLFQLPGTLASASFRDPSSSANPQTITYLSAYSSSGSENARFIVGLDITNEVTLVSSSEFVGSDSGVVNVKKLEGPVTITTSSVDLDSTGSLRIQQGQSLRIKDGISFDIVLGCINPNAINYNPSATVDDGSCILNVQGCTDPNSLNYNPSANIDDGSCEYGGCTDPTAYNYDPNASVDNGTCQYVTIGDFSTPKKPFKQYVKSNSSALVPKVTKHTLVNIYGMVYNGPYYTDSIHGLLYGNIQLSPPNNFDDNAILYLSTNNQRKYTSDNVTISSNLPAAYKAVVGQDYHKCSNCIFNKNNWCTKWSANIRANFWCAAYKPANQLIMGGDTYRSLYPGMPQYGFYTSGNEFLLPTNNSYYVGSYNITKDGIYETGGINSITLMLKPSLAQGPNKHFTKINQIQLQSTTQAAPAAPAAQAAPTTQTTQTTQTTPTYSPPSTTTTSAPATSTGGTGTSYSY